MKPFRVAVFLNRKFHVVQCFDTAREMEVWRDGVAYTGWLLHRDGVTTYTKEEVRESKALGRADKEVALTALR